ncbi:MAG: 3-isopropylmalate dehydratase large subunit [Betaproteobacteria bacterium]|nr:3-isopropylmalate dehydratase large subunit [Betaproteobacteria bacterium]
MTAPALTLAEKLIARAAGRRAVSPGEIVTCKVDLAMFHDSSGPRRLQPMLERLGAQVWDPSRIVLITDHYLPADDEESRSIQAITRNWARSIQLKNFYDGIGICHVVLPEKGHLRPGMLAVGGDSHSPTGGAFGAYMFGVGATEMLGVVVTGEIWLRVPHTILLEWNGRFADGVSAKDVMLSLCARFGLDGARYEAIEYAGSAIRAFSMQERMTLCNMSAELGAQTALIAPDACTLEYLAAAGVRELDAARWRGDPGATPLEHHRFDAAALEPHVAAPHSPANAAPVSSHAGTKLDIAYLGACTGAKLDDLRMAARVLKGRRATIELIVAPASLKDREAARADGTLQALEDAGASFLATACGACAGYGQGFAPDTRIISSTARNFKGRMGDPTAQVYLGSPYTVAAAAVAGRIVDPREMLTRSRSAREA